MDHNGSSAIMLKKFGNVTGGAIPQLIYGISNNEVLYCLTNDGYIKKLEVKIRNAHYMMIEVFYGVKR
ncbi:hypothetical protein [Haloplasma contractile]|uniref:Uncharacterized protein n=1 Tax=Haloplasma contractile SSD-17B TaxID=1033810 RepID=U2FD30_9MOLU|nr:hypothetical protein [Haloplasma contractile]ERJ10915.1 hypothetical protein HLPCO_003079 [Haloplasma contractile SSD-17B]